MVPFNYEFTIIIPVRNEARNLEILIPDIIKNSKCLGNYQIIIINHYSVDNSAEILKNFSRKYPNIKHINIQTPNAPLGIVFRAVINYINSDYIITMDGDLSHPARFIPQFFQKFREGYDIVLGSRYLKGQAPFRPLSRYYISRIVNYISKILIQVPINDFTTGFRGFKKSVYNSLNLKSKDFNMHLELNAKLSIHSDKVIEIPIRYIKRRYGNSKLKYIKQFHLYGLSILYGLFYHLFAINQLKKK